MNFPAINEQMNLVVKGTVHKVICTDLFDGGYGHYFDAFFPKATRPRFRIGEQCTVVELGEECLADFASYPKRDGQTVRFLIPKWS
jgi:hypothetical protein